MTQGRLGPRAHAVGAKFWPFHLCVWAEIQAHQSRQRFIPPQSSDVWPILCTLHSELSVLSLQKNRRGTCSQTCFWTLLSTFSKKYRVIIRVTEVFLVLLQWSFSLYSRDVRVWKSTWSAVIETLEPLIWNRGSSHGQNHSAHILMVDLDHCMDKWVYR